MLNIHKSLNSWSELHSFMKWIAFWLFLWYLGGVVAMIVWYLDFQLPLESVLITTDVVSLNLDQGEVYHIMW
jgi:hypothetical protein